jgi:hypothetical protein
LSKLSNVVKKGDLDVTFDFSGCNFLRQNAVAFIDGLARFIQRKGGNVRFALSSIREEIKRNFLRNGFLSKFYPSDYERDTNIGNAIP